MAAKRPTPKPPPPSITDEWGIYDPAKAGMPALFARLGRPVLTAGPTSARRERRRAFRQERSGEGVGLAIAEARKRAGLLDEHEHPGAIEDPARAIRQALRAQGAPQVSGTPGVTPFVPPPQPPLMVVAPEPAEPAPVEAPAAKKRAARKPVRARSTTDGPDAVSAPLSVAVPNIDDATTTSSALKTRGRRAPARGRGRVVVEAEVPASKEVPVAAAAVAKPVVPAPSPRRPRGPVPLAAWAHAVVEPPKAEPRGGDKRGFWRGIFRIPTEVALVEYAHGAKIHRLVIEAGDDLLPDFI